MHYRREHFVVDGALRDLWIADTDVDDWQRVVSSLSTTGWSVDIALSAPEGERNVLGSIPELFDRLAVDGEMSVRLSVRVDDLWLTCYFFDDEEIEFTFDPRDVTDETSFASLERFMVWLGDTSGRRVVMTMETSTDHRGLPVLLEYVPDSGLRGQGHEGH